MKTIKFLMMLWVSAGLLGCTYISNTTGIQSRDKDYLAARSIPPIRIPPGIATNGFRTYYPVSDRYYAESARQVNLTPPGLND